MILALKVALRYLISSKGSTLLITFISFFGVFLSVSAILLTLGVFTGFQDTLKEKILSSTPHIIVSVIGGKDPFAYEESIRSHQQVETVVPFLLYHGILSKSSSLQPVTVKAIRVKDLKELLSRYKVKGDPKLGDGNVVLGKGVADSLGAKVGSKLLLINPLGVKTPTGFLPKTKEVKVSAIFETGAYDKDFVVVFVDLTESKRFFKRGFSYEGIEVYIKDPYSAQEVKRDLEKMLKEDLVIVRSWIDLNKPLFNALQLEKLALFLILLLMVVVASFNITSLLFVKSREKLKDVAVLKAFGMQTKEIATIFVSVGALIGLVGATSGVLFSFGVAQVINEYKLIRVPEEVYMMSYIPVHIKTSDLISVFLGTIILAVLSSLLPSLKIAREKVVSVLRNE